MFSIMQNVFNFSLGTFAYAYTSHKVYRLSHPSKLLKPVIDIIEKDLIGIVVIDSEDLDAISHEVFFYCHGTRRTS